MSEGNNFISSHSNLYVIFKKGDSDSFLINLFLQKTINILSFIKSISKLFADIYIYIYKSAFVN